MAGMLMSVLFVPVFKALSGRRVPALCDAGLVLVSTGLSGEGSRAETQQHFTVGNAGRWHNHTTRLQHLINPM